MWIRILEKFVFGVAKEASSGYNCFIETVNNWLRKNSTGSERGLDEIKC